MKQNWFPCSEMLVFVFCVFKAFVLSLSPGNLIKNSSPEDEIWNLWSIKREPHHGQGGVTAVTSVRNKFPTNRNWAQGPVKWENRAQQHSDTVTHVREAIGPTLGNTHVHMSGGNRWREHLTSLNAVKPSERRRASGQLQSSHQPAVIVVMSQWFEIPLIASTFL